MCVWVCSNDIVNIKIGLSQTTKTSNENIDKWKRAIDDDIKSDDGANQFIPLSSTIERSTPEKSVHIMHNQARKVERME